MLGNSWQKTISVRDGLIFVVYVIQSKSSLLLFLTPSPLEAGLCKKVVENKGLFNGKFYILGDYLVMYLGIQGKFRLSFSLSQGLQASKKTSQTEIS